MPNLHHSPESLKKIAQLEAEIQLMKRLTTSVGFYEYYFSQLKYHTTNVECFNKVNETYFNIFGEERYSDYRSFMISNKNKR